MLVVASAVVERSRKHLVAITCFPCSVLGRHTAFSSSVYGVRREEGAALADRAFISSVRISQSPAQPTRQRSVLLMVSRLLLWRTGGCTHDQMPDGHAKCPAAHTAAGCVKLLQTADAPRVPVDAVVMMSELLSSWSVLKCGMNELFGYACV